MLQGQLGDLRQKIGMLEVNLQAIIESRDLSVSELKSTHAQLADVTTRMAFLQAESAKVPTISRKSK